MIYDSSQGETIRPETIKIRSERKESGKMNPRLNHWYSKGSSSSFLPKARRLNFQFKIWKIKIRTPLIIMRKIVTDTPLHLLFINENEGPFFLQSQNRKTSMLKIPRMRRETPSFIHEELLIIRFAEKEILWMSWYSSIWEYLSR
jgi:hypothetical protein